MSADDLVLGVVNSAPATSGNHALSNADAANTGAKIFFDAPSYSTFSFRNTGDTSINTLMVARGGGTADDSVFLDDIYFGLGDFSGTKPVRPHAGTVISVQ